MILRIGIENNIEGRSLAWALDLPGCFSYGPDSGSAIIAMPRAAVDYQAWMEAHTPDPWLKLGDFDVRLVDTWDVYFIDDSLAVAEKGYEVNAWFRDDWIPLCEEEISRGLALLNWSRMDLLDAVKGLPQKVLEARLPGERWHISGILRHVATAENWYLDRLGLAACPHADLPQEAAARLELTREHLRRVLPTLAGRADLVRGVNGEFWSPRKLLRRAVWHERDHVAHIHKLVAAMAEKA
ncbi:MAG TPA: DinB family protein [Anaerolineaceae bacterium]|nr:DinB family protein [Anaerolineaceae bacterium]HPN50393.1 DinB family protein [Anaerolineaceae bacterium]